MILRLPTQGAQSGGPESLLGIERDNQLPSAHFALPTLFSLCFAPDLIPLFISVGEIISAPTFERR